MLLSISALLCKIAALRSFSLDKLHYWRESDSGMSSLAYFLSKDTMDHFNTVIKPVVYLSMFYFLTNPRSTFTDNYIVLLCLVYCVTGIAYALSVVFEPGAAQLVSPRSKKQKSPIPQQKFIHTHVFNLHFSSNTIPYLAVVSTSSSCFDSHCNTTKR
jgi:hypothetical protein